jgi:AhpD family alkylhydroperoxidase
MSGFGDTPLNPGLDAPLYWQLYLHLRAAILSGRLKKGAKLPSTRSLADELHISRNTVLSAYQQLAAEGYLDSVEASGTFVASVLPDHLLMTLPASSHAHRNTPVGARRPRLSSIGEALAAVPDSDNHALSTIGSIVNSGLEASLLELIKTRESQINGCAYCVDMHTKDAGMAGETEQRLYALSVWQHTPFYTEREHAALAFTEAVTLIADEQVPDQVYEQAREHFGEAELVNLVMNIITINAWNRLSITFRDVPGTYQPKGQAPVDASAQKQG